MKDLTIRDGFNFGCGFFVAAGVYSIVLFLIIAGMGLLLGGGLLTSLIGLAG